MGSGLENLTSFPTVFISRIKSAIVLCAVFFAAWATPQFSNLHYTSDEQSSAEEGKGGGVKSTNCSCGWTNKARVVGGRETGRNEYPLVVAIARKSTKFTFCGASILTRRHALTASHCTEPMKGAVLILIAGAHEKSNERESTRVEVDISYTIEHEGYNRLSLQNDIALLVLASPIPFNQNIGPVCLPTRQLSLVGQWIKVLGWGRLASNGASSDVLMKVNLKVFSIDTCAKAHVQKINVTHPTQICTYRNQKDSCQGDSGGPLIWLDPQTNRYTQVALVSYGKACASKAPAVNTDVGYYVPWIQAKIAQTGLGGQTCSKV
ncbi:serine-type endopeptidase activity [Nesidiocoris tenuis]|uniref:Serine-type endopeptidase activity n=1 Tax=Nesidiocoris tenuis TaxID=355587 RepID=A0ABN7A7Z0_9HEMI|nr:serine-type endopeptidase activity [Nesidiocoris tenuis]